MPSSTFHSLRFDAVRHARQLSTFAEEVGAGILPIQQSIIKHAAPSLVAVIGTRDSGKSALVGKLLELPAVSHQGEETYIFTHDEEYPPEASSEEGKISFHALNNDYLKKLSYVEVRREEWLTSKSGDPIVERAEGLLIIIDARSPWAGLSWDYLRHYSELYAGRIIVCVTKTHLLQHKNDKGVLRKHLLDKLKQVTRHPLELKFIDQSDLFIFQEIRDFLEDKAIGERKWEELRLLKADYQDSLSQIHNSLEKRRTWTRQAGSVASTLRTEINELNHRIRLELLLQIERMGANLTGQADEILDEIRSDFTNTAYLKSLVGVGHSLGSFQDSIHSILSEALYEEIAVHYEKVNRLISHHLEGFTANHPQVRQLCSQLADGTYSPLSHSQVDRGSVNREIHTLLRNLRLKPLFREELAQIDELSSIRLRLSMVFLIAAGAFGMFSFSIIGILFLLTSVGVSIWAFWERGIALDDFVDFIEEWFLSVGAHLSGPVEKLSTELVSVTLDRYGECYIPYLELIKKQQEILPVYENQWALLKKENTTITAQL